MDDGIMPAEDMANLLLVVFAPIVMIVLSIVVIGFRHKRREQKAGNANASFWGSLLPATRKSDNFAAMSVDKLIEGLIKRVLLLVYFIVVVIVIRVKFPDDMRRWIFIGLGGIPLSWGLLGGLFMRGIKDFGRCREIMHYVIPLMQLMLGAFLSMALCWFYAFKFVYEILAISVFIWKKKKGLLDDVQENPDAEDKVLFGSYKASEDEDLQKEEAPFESFMQEEVPVYVEKKDERKLEDGTVIEKDFGGVWCDKYDYSRKFEEVSYNRFVEKP